jgi:RNA polymerase sigma-70 factor (ECF subfamily)
MARSDEQLMAAYVAGDTAAFRELFTRYAPLLQGVMRKRLGNAAEVDDLVQQTFLHLHRARHDFREGAKLRPWLFTIAFNLQRELFRRRTRRPEDPTDRANGFVGRPGGHDRVDAAKDLSHALDRLPPEQREVIILHWFEDLSFAEIATAVQASLSAVKVRAHRGYQSLRAMLENGNSKPSSDIRTEAGRSTEES